MKFDFLSFSSQSSTDGWILCLGPQQHRQQRHVSFGYPIILLAVVRVIVVTIRILSNIGNIGNVSFGYPIILLTVVRVVVVMVRIFGNIPFLRQGNWSCQSKACNGSKESDGSEKLHFDL
jgi:hypothetical protein